MSTIIKSKARVFGECINSLELLAALKNPVFKDNLAPVQMSSRYDTGFLKMVFKCPHCKNLHFVCGEMNEDQHIDSIIQSEEIYADHFTDGKYVTRGELINILDQLTSVVYISLTDTKDSIHKYNLTLVYKCSDTCPSVHLDCAYESNSLDLN